VVELAGVFVLVAIFIRLEEHHYEIGRIKLARSKLRCKVEIKLFSRNSFLKAPVRVENDVYVGLLERLQLLFIGTIDIVPHDGHSKLHSLKTTFPL
jgi:hypothetical protein